MKNIFFKTIAILCCLYLVSCDSTDVTNDITRLQISCFDSSDKMITNTETHPFLDKYLKEVQYKIIPADTQMETINKSYYSSSDGTHLTSSVEIPLHLNFSEEEYPNIKKNNPEEFKVQILHKNSIIHEEDFLLHYDEPTNRWPSIVKGLVKNDAGEWKPFSQKKIAILNDKGEDTGFYLSILFNYFD